MFGLLDRLPLSRKLTVLGLLFLGGFAAFVYQANDTVKEVGVGGHYYQRVIRGKDIVADVLPPPEYIIETHLLVYQALDAQDPATLSDLVQRSRRLRTEYDTRHRLWDQQLEAGRLREMVVVQSYAPARDYFDVRDREFFPALLAGDRVRARQVLDTRLEPLYQQHRRAIDEVVTLANADATGAEEAAVTGLSEATRTLLFLAAIVIGVLILAGWVIRRTTAHLRDQIGAISAVARRVAAGDLSQVTVNNGAADTHDLVEAIRAMTESLRSVVTRVKQASVVLTSTASQLTSTSREQDAMVQTLSTSTAQTAVSSKEISTTSQSLQRTMRDVAELSGNAASVAESGRVGLVQMHSSVDSLEKATLSISGKLGSIRERATDITGIVSTMTKVAEQTNLLSVNAAIEAEKAGEQGRGFLVVAREIRRLADQSAVASLDIEHMVRQMQTAVTSGVLDMDRFAENVRRVAETTAAVGGQLGEVIDQMRALSDRIATVHEGMQSQAVGAVQISEAMLLLKDGASNTATSVTELRMATGGLDGAVSSLREEIARFSVS